MHGKSTSAEKLLSSLDSFCYYDSAQGTFIKKCNPPGKRTKAKIGSRIDYAHNRGYRVVWLHNKPWLLHHLVWLWYYGELPEQLDHINGNKEDNRIEDLRECSQELNTRNAKMRKDNTSGYTGISFYKPTAKWRLLVQYEGKRKGLGYFYTLEEAVRARDKFYEEHPELGYTERHGE